MNKTIKAGIAGAAGYTGGELIRLLLRHPNVEIRFAHSKSNAGNPVHSVHRDLAGETDLHFAVQMDLEAIDVLFLCLGHGEAQSWLSAQTPEEALRVIDLSQDYRAGGAWGRRSFQYGLPELYREQIRRAGLVANPGCFATALQLALLPLAAAGLLGEVFATGITGATGAGQSLSPTSHFPWRHANVSAYKTLQHQHYAEVMRSLRSLGGQPELHFVPWRGDFPRGIYLSCTTRVEQPLDELQDRYEKYYATHPFTVLSHRMIDLKMAVNTNKCFLHLEKNGPQLVVHAALDNLLKGASGQALQNMNLMFGLAENTGLDLKASVY